MGANLPSEPETDPSLLAQSLERVCSRVVLCNKSIAMYPQRHPRVAASLEQIRAALAAYRQEEGAPVFSLDTEAVLEEPESRFDPSEKRQRLALARMLQMHLIARVTCDAHTTIDELFQFCFLLQEDFLRKAVEECEVSVAPKNWQHIHLELYEPQDLPDSASTNGFSLLDRADMLKGLRGVEPILQSLPPEPQASLRETLSSAMFSQRTTRLQQAFSAAVPASWKTQGECCDLVAEAMRTALDLQGTPTESQADAEQIVVRMTEILAAVERDVVEFCGNLGPPPSGISGPTTRREQIRATDPTAMTSGGNTATSHQLKQRLAFLFRTGCVRPAVKESIDETPPSRLDETPSDDGTVTFPTGIEEFHPPPLSSGVQHVQIILEMLSCDERRQAVFDNWEVILTRLLEIGRNTDYFLRTVEEIAHFLKRSSVPEVEALLDQILFRVTQQPAALEALQTFVLPVAGSAQVERYFRRLCRRSPRKAIVFLSFVDRHGKEAIQSLAVSQLTALAQDAALLAAWSAEDPTCFARPVIQTILSDLAAEDLRAAFRGFFAPASHEKTVLFLDRLPRGVTGLENVLFTAMDHGSPSTRKRAMTQLGQYPTSQVIRTLIEVVKLNNYREKPYLPEVGAALTALLDIPIHEAQRFLHEIPHKRRWFFRVYRRPIRRLLLEAISTRESADEETV